MPGLYLISYDIAGPRRLRRVHKALKRWATPIQYSVFFAELTDAGLAGCVAELQSMIDARKDELRIYPLPRDGWSKRLGRALYPAGIHHTGVPEAWAGLPLARDATDRPAARAPAPGLTRREARQARAIQSRVQTGLKGGLLLIR